MLKGDGPRTCIQCGIEFTTPPRRGRPPTICSAECRETRKDAQNRDYETRNSRRNRRVPCVDCGKLCQRSKSQKGWHPPPEQRCRPCRSAYARAASAHLTTCRCGGPKDRAAVTCLPCLREEQKTHRVKHPPKSSYERGYNRRHKRLRQAWQVIIEISGVNCVRCGEPISPDQSWHLDHTEDRTGYLGPSHSRCNLKAGNGRSKRVYAIRRTITPEPVATQQLSVSKLDSENTL